MITSIWSWQFLILATSYFSPWAVALCQNPKWPNWKKYAVSIALHTLIAFGYLGSAGYITRDIIKSGQQLIMVSGMLFFYSILSYSGVWKPKGINAKVATLKSNTMRRLGLPPSPNPPSPSNKLLGDNDDSRKIS